ncbi:YveK family protein [Actinomadura macrotermitis]|uniref:Capsular polysaccharide biosynthesis protein n=1 Tax=Actinomadura macrotermitis TaxID=2585200 RepID=A0A7K0C0B5_9ACTN|nr:hypothetical protein [Actinomadura macrotermitis]MQY06908.1 hypothetical protein [Actinomadura macrotermitis]
MEIDEVAARVARTYWALLLVMTVVPVVLVGFVMSGRTPPEVARTRLQASSKATDAAPGDAGVSIVVSQVKAFATSRNLLDKVLKDKHLDRDPDKLAKAISVTGLGTSTVVELGVKDTDGAAATALADAIGAAVVEEINDSNQGGIKSQLKEIDKRVRYLEGRLGPLSQRAGAVPAPDIAAGNERERVQAELTDLRASRSELRTDLTTSGTAAVVQPAVLAPRTNPVVMMAAIAGLVGLIGGILVAVVVEMVRPTVPGQQRVARRLGVPLLGWADRSDAELADLGRRVRLAARRAGVVQVTLVGAGNGPLPAELVSRIAAAVYGDGTKVVTARPVADPDGGEPADGGGGTASSNNSGPKPGGTGGTSVVRAGAGTAVLSKKSSEAAAASPAQQRAVCHVHAFEDVDAGAGDEAGVVAVAGPVTPVAGLDSVRDLVAASGWPLLGVVATSRKTTGRKSKG